MKSSALVAMLNIPESTIRKYAGDYAEYLSPTVNAGAGRHRDYTDHDARVLKLVIDMKAAKESAENIDITLRSLQDGGWERLPALDDNALAMIPTPAALLAAQADRGVLQREIELLREQIDSTERQLEAEREGRRADVERMTEAHKKELLDLQYKLVGRAAELEMVFKMIKDGRIKPEDI